LFEMMDLTRKALPNPGHVALAELESMGLLQSVITQNIDNLHQAAGSARVIEYHGNVSRLQCIHCGSSCKDFDYNIHEIAGNRIPPLCRGCGEIMKPSVILFGETIPRDAMMESEEAAQRAEVVLVVGTSAVVYPAAGIPLIAKRNSARIIEFNMESTDLTRYATDLLVLGKAGATLPELVKRIKSR
ncbi:MAG: hypothetical protein E4G96_08905, partial [Chrysiogenales bacterium]